MYVGVDTNKGMVYYKIAFANPKACLLYTAAGELPALGYRLCRKRLRRKE